MSDTLRKLLVLLLLPVSLSLCAGVRAATLPTGFEETQVSGLTRPTAMAFAPDGRLFICEQSGGLRILKNGALLATPFVTLTVNSSGERGLLGVAFDPDFTTNNYIYLYYTTSTAPIHNRISRFTANGDVAVAGSETIVLDLNNLSAATNHNGGAMHFGPDGKLYVAVGENATSSNAQSPANLLGKMLRINSDGTVPTDNPFYNNPNYTGINRAIWSMGLRNPFTFNFQPGTGRMFINDVGQNTWEEVNDGIAGSNYGWPTCEGNCNNPSFRNPLHQYPNATAECAITGGTFYNPATSNFPANYNGKYFIADFCAGWVKTIDPASPTTASDFATNLAFPIDLQVASDGSFYYIQRGTYSGGTGTGVVSRVRYTANQSPTVVTQPASQTVSIGQNVTFSVSANGTAPFSYQWTRNGVNIANATSSSYTFGPVAAGDNGAQFRCVITNSFGSITSNAATLTVTPNQAPVANIITPSSGTSYAGGDTISYSGSGTDPEDGNLPASAYTWTVDFHHDTHTHPFIAPTNGATGGSFTIPTVGETETNVFYRIYLTVRDSQGATTTISRDIQPLISQVTLNTNPAGLQITLDGQPQTAPFTVNSVVGIIRQIGTTSPQTIGSNSYTFSSWSDGGSQTHEISTPPRSMAYTANFNPVGNPTVQFSDAAYSVNEGAGRVTLTVTKAGSTSIASTVKYQTNDNLAFVECAFNNNTAQQRCDYTTTGGTLTFGVNETSKTIVIPLVEDMYAEGAEAFTVSLSNPTGGVALGTNATATVNITDNDTTTANTTVYVAQLSAAQEVPTNNSPATGNGTVTLNTAETQIIVNMSFSGLTSAQTAAHIHGAAQVGVNAPVLFNLGTGTITNATFNVTPAQVAQLKAGLFYFNIHTSNFGGGEIRGQILANPLEVPRFFVRQQYLDFLNREPDTAGSSFWTNEIVGNCGTDLTCLNRRRIEVSAAFFIELEFQETGAYVYRLYKAAFGEQFAYRPSYAQFVPDRARVVGGADVNAGKLELANDFVTRSAFTTRYPASQTPTQFVDAILQTVQQGAGVTFTTAERNAFISDATANGRGTMLRNLGDNAAFRAAVNSRAFVLMQYFGYLRRDPDQGGYDFWLGVLNGQPNNPRGMVCAFVTAAEYQQRFSGGATRNDMNSNCNSF